MRAAQRSALALVAGAALTATLAPALGPGVAAADAQQPAARPATSIDFGSCGDFGLVRRDIECGYLTVPMDWSKPGGRTIKLAVSRLKATAKKYQGVLVVNPGGPGGSGLEFAGLRDLVPDQSGLSYDWIGFDPRGVGQSKPALSCVSDFGKRQHPPYVPAAKTAKPTASERAWLRTSKAYAEACGQKHGRLLENMRSLDTVRDIEALRTALGVSRINYLGFSYGTYLGQVYATRYPDRVRRMILDGNVHADRVWYQAQLHQDLAFDRVADQFFAWVARHHKTYLLGTSAKDVRARYYQVLADLRTQRHNGIGANEWTDTFVHGMYAEFLWPELAHSFALWIHREDMISMRHAWENAQDETDNLFAVYNAVQCSDRAWPADYATWRKDAFRTAAKAPFLTWSNVWFNTACLYWPAEPGTPVTVDGSAAPPILLLNSTGDGATPYSGALRVRELFPRARLVADMGTTTHSGSLFAGNPCLDRHITAYLVSGKLPPRRDGRVADIECIGTPKPKPGLYSFSEPVHASEPEQPAPVPEPPAERSVLDSIIGLLPQRGF